MTGLRFALISCLLVAACNRGSQHYLELGNDLAKAGKFEDASLNYRKAIQKNPKFGEAYYRLGTAEIRNHMPLNALVDLRKAQELMPGDDKVTVALCELTITVYSLDPKHSKDTHDRAVKLVEQLQAKSPDGFDSNRLKGALMLMDGHSADAVTYLRKADAAKAGDQETEMGLAQALIASGEGQQGVELARTLISRDETYGKAYDLLVNYYRGAGKPQEAEQVLKLKISSNPDRGDYILQLAGFYASQNKSELVSSTLQQLTDRPSAFPDARLAVGDFYISLGKPDEALRQYEEGLHQNPKDTTPYRSNMIQILSAQRKWPQAYEQADLLSKEHPADPKAKLARVSLWMGEGKTENMDQAISELRVQLAAKPTDPAPLYYQLGAALLIKGDRDGARQAWMAALQKPGYLAPRVDLTQLLRDEGRTDDALKLSDEALKLAAGNVQVRLLHATCLTAAGKYTESRSELSKLSADNPKWLTPRYQLAIVDMHEGKYAEAEAAFRKLLTEWPAGEYTLVSGMVDNYARQNRTADGIRLLQDQLRHKPDALPLQIELARRAMESSAFDLAIEQYKSIITAAPGNIEAQAGLIRAYMVKGDRKAATDLLDQVNRVEPNSIPIKLLTAKVQEQTGQIAPAKETYRRIIAIDTDNSEAKNNLAFLMADSGDNLDEAMKLAKSGVESLGRRNGLPVDVEVNSQLSPGLLTFASAPELSRNVADRLLAQSLVDTIGWIYLKKKSYDRAVQCFQAVVRDDSASPEYHYHLGAALLQKGDKQRARLELSSALAAKPAPTQESAIRELLAQQ